MNTFGNRDLDRMTDQVVSMLKAYEKIGTKPWDYSTALRDLSVQLGSLTKCMMKLEGQRYDHGQNKETLLNNVKDELADIVSLVLFIAHELGIDMYEAWERMLASDREKIESRG